MTLHLEVVIEYTDQVHDFAGRPEEVAERLAEAVRAFLKETHFYNLDIRSAKTTPTYHHPARS